MNKGGIIVLEPRVLMWHDAAMWQNRRANWDGPTTGHVAPTWRVDVIRLIVWPHRYSGPLERLRGRIGPIGRCNS